MMCIDLVTVFDAILTRRQTCEKTAVLRKLFDVRFSCNHCNFSRICLLVKMASKTVTGSIIFLYAVRPRYANYLPCVSIFKVRPLVGQEKVHNASQCVRFIPDKPQLILGKDRGFTFDYVFSPKFSQVRYIVFEKSVTTCLQTVQYIM